MGPIQSLDEFVDLVRRRAGLLLLVAAIGVAASVTFALRQPHSFQASAIVQITSPALTGATTTSNGESTARQLQQIDQRLTSRDHLLSVIAEYGLFSDIPGLTETEKVTLMRESVRIEHIPAAQGGPTGTLAAVIVTARMGHAELAAAIANEFALSVVEEGNIGRAERLAATVDFYSRAEADLVGQIAALEAELSAFKSDNEALLPESLPTGLRMDMSRLREGSGQLERQLAALERERTALEAEGDRILAQRQIAAINDEISGLVEERNYVSGRISEIEAQLQRAPDIQREINAYERQLSQLRESLLVTVQRRQEAELGQRIADEQRAERFDLVERALPPDYPDGTSRRNIAAAGGLVSVGLAFGLALLMDMANPVIRSAAQMQRELNLRPVVSIPYVATRAERSRRRMLQLGMVILLAIALLIISGLVLV